MFRRSCRAAVLLLAGAALVAPTATTQAAEPAQRVVAQRWGEITRIDAGFRFRASQHDSRLLLTRVGDRVRFHDRALRRWLSLPRGCRRVAVERGIAATCRVPSTVTPASPLTLEIVPRLGDDRVNGSALGAEFELRVLGDAGDDVAYGGAGRDQLVGTVGDDELSGGLGDDVLEGGVGNDTLLGGPGEDSLLCGDGFDTTDDDGQTDLVRHCEDTVE